MLVKLAAIFFSMILVNNYVLVKFYGICPFLGVSKKLDSSLGMSGAVIFVMLVGSASGSSNPASSSALNLMAPAASLPSTP